MKASTTETTTQCGPYTIRIRHPRSHEIALATPIGFLAWGPWEPVERASNARRQTEHTTIKDKAVTRLKQHT